MEKEKPSLKETLKKPVDIGYLINAIFIIIIACGIGTSIYMLFVNRSLWMDEASFAYSFSKRNLLNLTTSPFEWVQIAPIIYIYIVKIITVILGNSEITLRLFSVISYILVLILSYMFGKRALKLKYPLAPVAYIASMTFMLKYSNEFKSYMFDAAVCLFALFMYYLYSEKKISLKTLIIIYAISIWASNPVCFFIGGILLYEFIVGLIDKDYKHIRNIIIGALGILVSFVIYYFYWLRSVAQNPAMQGYWNGMHFPLIPTSIDDLIKMKSLIWQIIMRFDGLKNIVFLLAIVSLVIGIYKKISIEL